MHTQRQKGVVRCLIAGRDGEPCALQTTTRSCQALNANVRNNTLAIVGRHMRNRSRQSFVMHSSIHSHAFRCSGLFSWSAGRGVMDGLRIKAWQEYEVFCSA